MDPQPPSPDDDPERAAEAALLAARRAWQQDPNLENTAAYEAALDHAMDVLEARRPGSRDPADGTPSHRAGTRSLPPAKRHPTSAE